MNWKRLKLKLESWPLPVMILLLLIASVGQSSWRSEPFLLIGMLFYGPILMIKSYHRGITVRPMTTKVLSWSLFVFAAAFILHSIYSLISGNFLFPISAYHFMVAFIIIIDISEHTFLKLYHSMHPALAFVSTFMGIIVFGASMLMLPEATVAPGSMHFIDALFTSTSAVCVTGLVVLDTGRDFTFFGQVMIILLIQAGGIGILTFTNLFGILFKGEKSFKDLIFLTDLVSADNLQGTFRHLWKIIFFVFVIEGMGAIAIYFSMPTNSWFFAIFHSVSAFCNAGFSTFSNSLYEPVVRHNYSLHTIIAMLIITGGIGYNVFFNVYAVFRFRIKRILYNLAPLVFGKPDKLMVKWDLNTTLVIRTTVFLLLSGWVLFFALEYNNTLAEHHSLGGKIAEAFFGSVTPRTAGFNTVDIGALLNPTIMIYLLLMWIGASPGSTGGGIKTTTFAIATLNLINQVRGREKLIYKWKTISGNVISRITTIISLSLVAVGLATCLIITFQPELPLIKVAFEAFSAYGTVGLSMNLTSQLSTASKLVIIALMFLGRVNFLTFLVAIFASFAPPQRSSGMEYPESNIFVN